jgi:hypothetical protein
VGNRDGNPFVSRAAKHGAAWKGCGEAALGAFGGKTKAGFGQAARAGFGSLKTGKPVSDPQGLTLVRSGRVSLSDPAGQTMGYRFVVCLPTDTKKTGYANFA